MVRSELNVGRTMNITSFHFHVEVTPWHHRAKGHSYLIAWSAFSAVAMWHKSLKGLGFEWILMSPDYFDFKCTDICIVKCIYLCWNLEAFTLRGGWVRQQEEINFLSLPFCFYYKVFLQLLLLSSFKANYSDCLK